MHLWAEVFILNAHFCKIDEEALNNFDFFHVHKPIDEEEETYSTGNERGRCEKEIYRQIPVHYLKLPLDTLIETLSNVNEESIDIDTETGGSYQSPTTNLSQNSEKIENRQQDKDDTARKEQLSALLYTLALTKNNFQSSLLKILEMQGNKRRTDINNENDYVSLYDVACALVFHLSSGSLASSVSSL